MAVVGGEQSALTGGAMNPVLQTALQLREETLHRQLLADKQAMELWMESQRRAMYEESRNDPKERFRMEMEISARNNRTVLANQLFQQLRIAQQGVKNKTLLQKMLATGAELEQEYTAKQKVHDASRDEVFGQVQKTAGNFKNVLVPAVPPEVKAQEERLALLGKEATASASRTYDLLTEAERTEAKRLAFPNGRTMGWFALDAPEREQAVRVWLQTKTRELETAKAKAVIPEQDAAGKLTETILGGLGGSMNKEAVAAILKGDAEAVKKLAVPNEQLVGLMNGIRQGLGWLDGPEAKAQLSDEQRLVLKKVLETSTLKTFDAIKGRFPNGAIPDWTAEGTKRAAELQKRFNLAVIHNDQDAIAGMKADLKALLGKDYAKYAKMLGDDPNAPQVEVRREDGWGHYTVGAAQPAARSGLTPAEIAANKARPQAGPEVGSITVNGVPAAVPAAAPARSAQGTDWEGRRLAEVGSPGEQDVRIRASQELGGPVTHSAFEWQDHNPFALPPPGPGPGYEEAWKEYDTIPRSNVEARQAFYQGDVQQGAIRTGMQDATALLTGATGPGGKGAGQAPPPFALTDDDVVRGRF